MTDPEHHEHHEVQAQARALGDPTRHRIFRHVADASVPVDVAELTRAFGLNHNAVRQHLAKLVAVGLLRAEAAGPRGRGRPRTVYRAGPAVDSRWGATGPYERLSRWLLALRRSGESPRELGRRLGAQRDGEGLDVLVAEMGREGFDPKVRRQGARVEVVLRSCPFADAALDSPDVVCELHRGLAEGLAGAGLVVDDLVVAEPRRGACRLLCRELP